MDKCLLTYDAFFKINGAENTAEQDESPENCGGPSVSLHAVSESVKPDVGSSQRQATDDCRYVREFSLAAISLSTASTYAHPPRPASTCGKIRFLETGCDVYVRVCVCVWSNRPSARPGDEAATSSLAQRHEKRQRLRRRRGIGWKESDADNEERRISDRQRLLATVSDSCNPIYERVKTGDRRYEMK